MALKELLLHYPHATIAEKENALKEVVQAIALLGLSRAGFFQDASFCGGTCLRLFYGLGRFSEDLDFALDAPKDSFSLASYLSELKRTFLAYGLNIEIGQKADAKDNKIQSAFVKSGTFVSLISAFPANSEVKKIISNQVTTVKIEVDTWPSCQAESMQKLSMFPTAFYVKVQDGPSLFAGKIHALICRNWKSRTKGRDLYDFLFYLQKGIPVNLAYLESKLVQSGRFDRNKDLTQEDLKAMLTQRFKEIDFAQAKDDVLPFIKSPEELQEWSQKFFLDSLAFLKVAPLKDKKG
jgi:predicted nucleotidyltransferase component of viral defense system